MPGNMRKAEGVLFSKVLCSFGVWERQIFGTRSLGQGMHNLKCDHNWRGLARGATFFQSTQAGGGANNRHKQKLTGKQTEEISDKCTHISQPISLLHAFAEQHSEESYRRELMRIPFRRAGKGKLVAGDSLARTHTSNCTPWSGLDVGVRPPLQRGGR